MLVGLAAAAGLAVATLAMAAKTTKSPAALYRELLTTPIPASQLPGGYYMAHVGVGSESKNGKAHHEVGQVEVDLDSLGDTAIGYEIFPTRADAIADWNAAKATLKKKSKSELAAPSRFPWPAIIANFSVTGKNALGKTVTNGATGFFFTSKNVIVEVVTTSTTNTDSGDIPGAIKLGDFALKHLDTVRG